MFSWFGGLWDDTGDPAPSQATGAPAPSEAKGAPMKSPGASRQSEEGPPADPGHSPRQAKGAPAPSQAKGAPEAGQGASRQRSPESEESPEPEAWVPKNWAQEDTLFAECPPPLHSTSPPMPAKASPPALLPRRARSSSPTPRRYRSGSRSSTQFSGSSSPRTEPAVQKARHGGEGVVLDPDGGTPWKAVPETGQLAVPFKALPTEQGNPPCKALARTRWTPRRTIRVA